MNNATVFVVVKLDYNDTFDLSEITENMDYDFVYEDAILKTEIVDVTEERVR